ncbi:hypothetical protein AB0L99_26480 [Streptomyces sp. NPDC051954]|uniref:hypothetical protein n=1 Tax=unclassified Streptomyces TaxID=2593676 RepID=UPI003438EC8A
MTLFQLCQDTKRRRPARLRHGFWTESSPVASPRAQLQAIEVKHRRTSRTTNKTTIKTIYAVTSVAPSRPPRNGSPN